MKKRDGTDWKGWKDGEIDNTRKREKYHKQIEWGDSVPVGVYCYRRK